MKSRFFYLFLAVITILTALFLRKIWAYLPKIFIRTDKSSFKLSFGAGQWVQGETMKLGPSLVLAAKNHFVGLPPSKIAGSYSWVNDTTLELTLRYIDSPHTEVYTCHFDKNQLLVDYEVSFNKKEKLSLKGSF